MFWIVFLSLFISILCQENVNMTDSIDMDKCQSTFNSCHTLSRITPSPHQPGKVTLRFTMYLYEYLCSYSRSAALCFNETTASYPQCENAYYDIITPFNVLEAISNNICDVFGEQEIRSLLECMNNEFVQFETAGAVQLFMGSMFTWERCKQDPEEEICNSLKHFVRRLGWIVRNNCAQSQSNILVRFIDALQGVENSIFDQLIRGHGRFYNCSFLSERNL